MILYSSLFLLCVVGAFFDFTNIKCEYKYIYLLIISVISVLLSGLRWQLGTDWELYLSFFMTHNSITDYIIESQNVQSIELGYGVYNYVIKSIVDEYSVFLMISSIVIIGLKMRWILKYSTLPMVALLVNFSIYLNDIFFIRQSIAIVITLFAFDYIVKRNIIKYIFCVVVAASIHTSALIAIPAYWIYHAHISLKKWTAILILAVFGDLSKINVTLLEYFLASFPSDLGKVVQKIHAYYTLEQNGENHGVSMDTGVRLYISYFRRVVMLPLYIYFSNKIIIREIYKGYLNLILFGYTMFFVLSMIGIDFAGRLSIYYYVYEILLIPEIIKSTNNIFKRICIFSLIVLYCAVKYGFLFYVYGDFYVPYNSVF